MAADMNVYSYSYSFSPPNSYQLTRQRVFWLMMIHEINFNSYSARLFAFEMKRLFTPHRCPSHVRLPILYSKKKKKSKKNTMRVLVFLLIPLFTASVVCNRTDSDTNSDTDSDSDSDSDSDWEYESKKSCLVSLALHHPAAKHLKPLNKSRQNGFVVLTLASVMSWFGFEKSRIILCTPYIHLYSHGPWFAVEKSQSSILFYNITPEMALYRWLFYLLSIHVRFSLSQRSRLLQAFHPGHLIAIKSVYKPVGHLHVKLFT